MQLTEIKNDLATINYSPELNRLMLSDFILIEDANQSILAQVISIEATMEDDVNSAMLKFLLSIDKDANLTQYSGYVPAKGATLILINPQEVVQLIKGSEKNIYIGDLASYPDVPVELSLDFLRKKPYIQVDFVENKLQIVEAIVRGLEKHNKKTLLFDFGGLYSGISLPTVTLGYNFKLPLNYDALCYIAEEELNDCGNDNKAIIQGILIEVQNYVKNTPEEFIPFDTLISVLDAQYDESPLPELLLLKNKLIKYQQQGLFAQEKSEFDFLDTFLKDAKNFKFDLSELPAQWHKIAFASILDLIKAKCYLITDFMDENSNKKIIKKLYEKNEIKPIVISSYNYKYQLQLKAMSKNMMLFKPIQKVNDFAGYTSFLNILSQDTFIVWGEQTLFIPLILKLQGFCKAELNRPDKIKVVKETFSQTSKQNDESFENADDSVSLEESENQEQDHIENDGDIDLRENEILESDNSDEILEDKSPEFVVEEEINDNFINEEVVTGNVEEEVLQKVEEDFEPDSIDISNEDSNIIEEVSQNIDLPNSDDLDFFFEENEEDNEANIDVPVEPADSSFNEPEQEIQDDDTISEGTVDNLEEIELDENLEYEDFDSSAEEPESEELSSQINGESINNEPDELEISADEITSEENSSDEILAEEIPIDEIPADEIPSDEISADETTAEEISVDDISENTAETQEEIVIPETKIDIKTAPTPIFKSNSAPEFDTKFAKGTYVHNPKYGRGVVEKVINYGSKQLVLIIFDNEGRKLLDPNVTELKQV